MKFSDRIKTYNFWVSIASAIFLIINLIGKRFNFTIDESAYNDMFTTFCSVLVLLGIIVPPNGSNGQISKDDLSIFEDDFENSRDYDDFLENSDEEKLESNASILANENTDLATNDAIMVSDETKIVSDESYSCTDDSNSDSEMN